MTFFFVWDFNGGREDFELIGAFSKQDEAQEFARTVTPMGTFKPHVAEAEWRFVLDQEVSARLGALANVIAIQGAAPWPGQAWVIEDEKDALMGVFLSAEAATNAYTTLPFGFKCRSIDIGKLSQ